MRVRGLAEGTPRHPLTRALITHSGVRVNSQLCSLGRQSPWKPGGHTVSLQFNFPLPPKSLIGTEAARDAAIRIPKAQFLLCQCPFRLKVHFPFLEKFILKISAFWSKNIFQSAALLIPVSTRSLPGGGNSVKAIKVPLNQEFSRIQKAVSLR